MRFTFKKDIKRKKPLFSMLREKKDRPLFASQELMSKQVKQVLGKSDQGLILMVRG